MRGAQVVPCSSAHKSYQYDRGWLSEDATTAGERQLRLRREEDEKARNSIEDKNI